MFQKSIYLVVFSVPRVSQIAAAYIKNNKVFKFLLIMLTPIYPSCFNVL